MQTKCRKRLPSCILCIVLIVAMAFITTGCNGSGKDSSSSDGKQASAQADGNVLGEGSKQFSLTVADQDGKETEFEIHTDQETVGAALQELELIEGEEGQYGLYVTTVNGITADFDKDGMYWAFYINGEYAQTGVDAAKIQEGESYSLKLEKA